MPKFVKLKDGTSLQLEENAFNSGGEGEIFRVTSPVKYQNEVVKIYKPQKRTSDRERKIEFLAANQPPTLKTGDHQSLIWVNQLVYENNSFCGYTMPIAKGEDLEMLCLPILSKKLGSEWEKFNLNNPKSLELRLKLCFNVAVAVYQIHKLGIYVVADMKPSNIRVQANGLISIIDIDSVAVIRNENILFPAHVATVEYTPPEAIDGIHENRKVLRETWDRFSMAVIFYRVLCGIHPFTGSAFSPYENCHSHSDMIKHGLFPNGSKGSYFKAIPSPHKKFRDLKIEIQTLFKRCFDDGHSAPTNRPDADEWCRNLLPNSGGLKRPLPSARFILPKFNYSVKKELTTSGSFDELKINFKSISEPKGVKYFLNNLLGNTRHKLILKQVTDQENKLKVEQEKYLAYKSEIKSIIAQFNSDQQTIIENEKIEFDQLLTKINADIAVFNNKAKSLEDLEALEIKPIDTKIRNSIQKLEKDLNKKFEELIGNRSLKYEGKKAAILADTKKLVLQQEADTRILISEPTKLAKFKIQDAGIRNFGYAMIHSLRSVGIHTAADFIDISSDGCFKIRNGNWVKASGIGWNRARDLQSWQRNTELKENQRITSEIGKKYDVRLKANNYDLKVLGETFDEEMRPFKTLFQKEKSHSDNFKSQFLEQYKKETKSIIEKYNNLHLKIVEEVKFYNISIAPKIRNLLADTSTKLEKCYDKCTMNLNAKILEVDDFSFKLRGELDRLLKLYDTLAAEKF